MANCPDAVTFDFHNTLATCDEWFQLEIRTLMPAFLEWYAKESGTTADKELAEQSVTIYRRLRGEIMDHGREVDAVTSVHAVAAELDLTFEPEAVERGVAHIMRAALDDSQPVPGVVEAVKALNEAGVRLGVVSSAAYHPFLEWSLEKFGILDHFDSIVTSASCGYYKTRTEIYEIALQTLQVAPSSAVHIGDSCRFDVETPARIGMPAIWYKTREERCNGHLAALIVDTLVGVEEQIASLFSGVPR